MLSELLLSLLLVSFDENPHHSRPLDEVVVTIDDRGVPKITGESRADVVRVQGLDARTGSFVPNGRVAARELCTFGRFGGPQGRVEKMTGFENFGCWMRPMRFTPPSPRINVCCLMAYADGVNAGAKAHPKTLEHTILQTILNRGSLDSICALQTMWAALSIERRMELVRGVISDLGPELFEFLARGRSHWDAPHRDFCRRAAPATGDSFGRSGELARRS